MPKLPDIEKSLWREAYPAPAYPKLTDDVHVDVAIVGAGITGLTSAYLLKQSGLTVAVVEKHTVGGGTTGRTTGKVTSQHNLFYHDLVSRLGQETARVYSEANQAAIERIETIVNNEKIGCDWQRDDNYVYTANPEHVVFFQQEATTALGLGLPASFETDTPLPLDVTAAVRFSNQAKIHSQKYLLGLARAINGNGSYIFEQSTVIGIRDGNPCRIRAAKAKILSKRIIVASSVPTLPLIARAAYGLLEYPSESYLVAGRLDRPL